MNLICAQRLLRTVCKDCKEPIDVPDQTLIDLQVKLEDLPTLNVHHGADVNLVILPVTKDVWASMRS